jgi:hypothetical protein
MTEWYCHFDPTEFAKAKEVQEALLRPDRKKAAEPIEGVKAGRVLSFPHNDNKETPQNKDLDKKQKQA